MSDAGIIREKGESMIQLPQRGGGNGGKWLLNYELIKTGEAVWKSQTTM